MIEYLKSDCKIIPNAFHQEKNKDSLVRESIYWGVADSLPKTFIKSLSLETKNLLPLSVFNKFSNEDLIDENILKTLKEEL